MFHKNNFTRHTFCLKNERSDRIVIRNLHQTTHAEELKKAFTDESHTPRNMLICKNNKTEVSRNLFFMNLNPKPIPMVYLTQSTPSMPKCKQNRLIRKTQLCSVRDVDVTVMHAISVHNLLDVLNAEVTTTLGTVLLVGMHTQSTNAYIWILSISGK